MRVVHEDEIARRERGAPADLDDTADAGVAELDRKGVATRERGQIERELRRHLSAEHEHLGAVRQSRGDGADTDLAGAGPAERRLAELDLAGPREPRARGRDGQALSRMPPHCGSP